MKVLHLETKHQKVSLNSALTWTVRYVFRKPNRKEVYIV